MGEPLIIEVADHRGRVRFRARLDPGQPQATVGRAPRNDVVIDDPYVDAHHLQISPTDSGGWRFSDLGSVNGVWLGPSGPRWTDGEVTAGLELRVGHSTLRFVSPDAPVPPAIVDPAHRRGVTRRLTEPRTLVAIGGVAVGFSAMTRYYGSTRPLTFVDLATPGLTVLIFTALWAAAWAFTNRLVAHRFQFLGHLAWAVLIATMGSALAIGREWLGFFVPSTDLSGLDVSVWWLVGALLLVGHFELVTEWPRARRWMVAAAATGVLAVAAVVLERSAALDDGAAIHEAGALKPLDVRYLPAASLDGFIRDAADLKTKVDDTDAEPKADVNRSRSDSSTATATRPHTSGRAPA